MPNKILKLLALLLVTSVCANAQNKPPKPKPTAPPKSNAAKPAPLKPSVSQGRSALELLNPANLAQLRETPTQTQSGTVKSGESISILEVKGQGVITRLYVSQSVGTLRLYLDGETKPRLECSAAGLFAGKVEPFKPLVEGKVLHYPIAFNSGCRLELVNAKGVRYDVQYRTETAKPTFATFTPKLSQKEKERLEAIDKAWEEAGAAYFHVNGIPGETMGRAKLDAGQTRTLTRIEGPAQVTLLRLKIQPADRSTLRQTLLRVYWDDADKPAVEVPLGDFFGSPLADVQYKSLYESAVESGSSCFLPMVFHKLMRVELVNLGKTNLTQVLWKVSYQNLDKIPENVGYLHAQWTRHQTEPNKSAVVWNATGRGHLVGLTTVLQNETPGFEYVGSDAAQIRVTADNAVKPNIASRLDAFFGLGSPLPHDAHDTPLHGTTQMEQTAGRLGAYRWLLADTVSFQQTARAEITLPTAIDVAATTFWYQGTPAHDGEPITADQLTAANFQLRNVIEAESLKWDGGTPTKSEDKGFKMEASGGAVMTFPVGTVSAAFPVPAEDVYTLNLAALIRPGSTQKYRYALDGEPFSEIYEASIAPLDAETTSLWITSLSIHLKAGTHKVGLQLLGNKPLYLDYLELMPSRKAEGVVEVENLLEQAKVSPKSQLTRNDDSAEYSGNSFLQWDNVTENAELSLPLEFPKGGDYRLELGIWRDIGSMKLEVKLDGMEIGDVDAFVSNADTNVLPLLVGKIKDIAAGKHLLTLTAHAPKAGKQGKINFDYYKLTRLAD